MKENDPELWAEKQRIKTRKRNLSKVGLSEEEYLAMGENRTGYAPSVMPISETQITSTMTMFLEEFENFYVFTAT